MDLPQTIFKDKQLYEKYLCYICYEIYQEPVQDNCSVSHIFCKSCITYWLHKSSKCPFSQDPLKLENLKENNEINEKLSELELKCINYIRKCEWEGKLKNYKFHLEKCPKRLTTSKSVLICGKGGKGSENIDDLVQKNSYLGEEIKLCKINMEFSKKISNWGYSGNYNCLSSIQMIFKKKSSNGGWSYFPGKLLGGGMRTKKEGNIFKKESFEINDDDCLTKIVIYKGKDFFPAIGFSTKKNKIRVFGFENFILKGEENKEELDINDNMNIIGAYGYTGWVVDKIGFIIQTRLDEL